MKVLFASAVAAFAAAWAGQAQDKGLVAVQAKEIAWQKAEGLPPGVMVAHASGDAKGGPAVDFIKFPAGSLVPLHWHSANHVVTVLSGKLHVAGTGALDKGFVVGPGGYFKIPAKMPHRTSAVEETVITVSGDAPNDLNWVKPD